MVTHNRTVVRGSFPDLSPWANSVFHQLWCKILNFQTIFERNILPEFHQFGLRWTGYRPVSERGRNFTWFSDIQNRSIFHITFTNRLEFLARSILFTRIPWSRSIQNRLRVMWMRLYYSHCRSTLYIPLKKVPLFPYETMFLKNAKNEIFLIFYNRESYAFPCFIYFCTRVKKSSIFRMSRMKILGHIYNRDNLLWTEDDWFCLENSFVKFLRFGGPEKGRL